MSVITLTSDFGLIDYRVSAIKGRLLTLDKTVNIIDITHQIDEFNLIQTTHIVKNSYPYFPNESVHLIFVDSFYHKDRELLIHKTENQYFISADNGLVELILTLNKENFERYKIHVPEKRYFTATDIFAPTAIYLANGGNPKEIATKTDEVKEFSFPKIRTLSERKFVGDIIYIDNFGNLVSNISRDFFEENQNSKYIITLRNKKFKTIYDSYSEIVTELSKDASFRGDLYAIFNEYGQLTICSYKGTKKNGAHNLCGINVGDNLIIEFE